MIRNQLSACLAMILFASAGIAALAPRTAQSAQAETGAESVADIEGLQLWLDAASVLAEDGEKLSVWENKAQSVLEGAGDAVQSEEARQPVYVAQSAALGGPSVRLSADTFFRVGGTQGFYLDDMTIIVVAAVDYDGNGTKEMISRISGAPTFNHNWFFNCENGLFNYGWGSRQGTGVAYHQARVPFESGRANVFAGRKSGSTGYTAVNGEILGTFAGTSPEDEKRPVYLGSDSGNTVDGDFGEVLIFNRGLSDAEMEKVYRYLYEKWDFERLDGSVLDDITVGGEQVSGFSPYRYEYDVIVSGDALPEFAAEARYAGAKVEKTVGTDAVVFRVTNEACVGTREYRINLRSLDAVENRYTRAGIGEVELNDGFWKDTLTQYVTRTAGYVYDMFDYSYSFDNFDRVAAGERKVLGNTSQHAGEILIPSGDNRLIGSKDGEWSWGNEPWREGLIYEEIRAVADIVSLYSGDPALGEAAAELKARTEGYVDRIYAAALTTTGEDRNGRRIDGYFSTFALLTQTGVIDETESGHIWTHDLYNYGCLVEAGISWYRATGDMRLLFAATRFTEFLLDYMYGEDGYAVVPSHQLAEEALLRLYDLYRNDAALVRQMEVTFDSAEGINASDRYYRLEIRWEEYINILKDWIEKRGVYEGRYQNTAYGDYAQDHATFDKQTTAAGHSVRANLWYSAIAAAGNYLDNKDYIAAANTIWNDIVGKQMYITGGTGSVHGSESYGGDYHLPHDGYCETCASVGMAFFAGNMSELFGQAEYADVLETQLYNGILGCLGMDGCSFYYQNPLTSDAYQRPYWSGATPCCPPMYMKIFADLVSYIYMSNGDSVIVDQYISSTADLTLDIGEVEIIQYSNLPDGDRAALQVSAEGNFTLRLRMPSWASSVSVTVDGTVVSAVPDADGYLNIGRDWSGKTEVEVTFGKEVIRVYQDEAAANRNQVALQYGPFIYCAETDDNLFEGEDLLENVVIIPEAARISVSYEPELFALELNEGSIARGANVLRVQASVNGEEKTLTMIPFYLRANRSHRRMEVWFWENTSVRGGKDVYTFDASVDTDFTVYGEESFTVTNGVLKSDPRMEGKILLNGYEALSDFRVEVDITPNSTYLNNGIYLFASEASDEQDKINALNVQLERASNEKTFTVSLFEFSSTGGYLGVLSQKTGIEWPQDETLHLRVVVYEGSIAVSVNGKEHLRYAIDETEAIGAVGLRSMLCSANYDNFALTCEEIGLHLSLLSESIEAAESLDPDAYKTSSRQLLSEALTEARNVLENAVCDDELETAAAKLAQIVSGLEEKSDLSLLAEEIALSERIESDDYTQASGAAFLQALERARAMTPDDDQAAIDEALAALRQAREELVPAENKAPQEPDTPAVVWPWVVFSAVIAVIAAGGIVTAVVVSKKKR